MTTPEKAKGSKFELDVAKYFNERGFPYVERRYGAGNTMDKGDLNGMPGVVFECKNLKSITLSTIIDETLVEQANAKADYGIAIIKRRNKSVAQSYAMLTLEQLISLLKDAGR